MTLQWTPHPLYKIPTREQAIAMGAERLLEFHAAREQAIALEQSDPFREGHEPASWKIADEEWASLRSRFLVGPIELLLFGGNRAAKSEYAAKRVMQHLVNKPGSRWWCLQSSEASSIQNQQSLLYKYLPLEWKPSENTGKLRKGTTTNITYTQKGGFTESTFVLPNRSQCWFKFYTMDVGTIEGAELDGVWLDELYTPEWLEAMRYRLVTRNGIALKTFTPVAGYTPAVKEELSGAKTIQETPAELLPIYGSEEL